MDDTIAAIGTPIGAAGIGIIRVSGEDAIEIVDRIFRSKNKKNLHEVPSHNIVYGHIVDEKGEVIDEVLVTVMLAPKSFTTENVVEINCHGGTVAVRKTLEAVLKAGARLAEPGEFAKRAFLNGRIDLAQAESIMDLINAKTAASLRVAVGQLEGKLSAQIKDIRAKLLELRAHIEAGIDFPEHDIEDLSKEQIKVATVELKSRIDKILESADSGKIFREGLKTVIIGKPNVGKSSLLNALVKEKRAIVTDIPGTTRDVIEEFVSIRGIPLKILDTAGIRETEDVVEKIGVQRSKEALEQADFFLFVVDVASEISSEDMEIAAFLKDLSGIIIANKTDLTGGLNRDLQKELGLDVPVVAMSLLNGQGLDELEEKIVDIVYNNEFHSVDEILVSNVRHERALTAASEYLTGVLETLENNMPMDCVTIDLNSAWEELGKITGETVGEDLLDQIFSQFCIGK